MLDNGTLALAVRCEVFPVTPLELTACADELPSVQVFRRMAFYGMLYVWLAQKIDGLDRALRSNEGLISTNALPKSPHEVSASTANLLHSSVRMHSER